MNKLVLLLRKMVMQRFFNGPERMDALGTYVLVMELRKMDIWKFSNGHELLDVHGTYGHVIRLPVKAMMMFFDGLWPMEVNGAARTMDCAAKLKYYNWLTNIACRTNSSVESAQTKSVGHFLRETTEMHGRRGILDCRILGNSMASKEGMNKYTCNYGNGVFQCSKSQQIARRCHLET